MKILNLCFADNAGAAYTLSHALNKVNDVQSINLRSTNNYIDYPTIAEMRFYKEQQCTDMALQADVIVFHTAVMPYLTALHLDREKLKGKRLIMYFHGSDARHYGTQIIAQADQLLGKGSYGVFVSTPDLLRLIPDATWMPVARSFSELRRHFALCNQDEHALKVFGGDLDKVVLAHAPTNQELKGSEIFFRVITSLVEQFKYAEFMQVQNMSWDAALRAIARADIFFDQARIGSYGLAAVEAAMFKEAVFVKLDEDVVALMEKESGLKNPFIQWASEAELLERSKALCENPALIAAFGQRAYVYAKKMHDERSVTDRFLKAVEAM